VVDAAGAIYVIGGNSNYFGPGPTYFSDVWASTDGGSRPDSVQGGGQGVAGWVLRGYSRGYLGVLQGYYRGTKG
jgi:hypothetical protein